MATSYTSNKKIGALDSASTPLAATNEIVINQNGDILKTPLSAVEAKVFDAKTAVTTPTGTEVVVVRQTDNTLRQVALADIVPALNITNAKVNASAAIEDTKLATINTAGKVTNQAVQATSANTANRIVARDGNGNFEAGTITATLSGNATTANQTANTLTRGSYLTGNNFNGAAATTWAVDATSANTANKVVARDGSGNFSAGTITAALTGNVTGSSGSCTGNSATATTLATGRTIALTGDVTGTTGSFNGSANVSAATTIANNAVTTAKIADASVTTAKLADANVTPAKLSEPSVIVNRQIGFLQNFVEFTGIPSYVKKITVSFYDIDTSANTNVNNHILVQIGPTSNYNLGNYHSTSTFVTGGAGTGSAYSNQGFILFVGNPDVNRISGVLTLTKLTSGVSGPSSEPAIWTAMGCHVFENLQTSTAFSSGRLLSGDSQGPFQITRLRVIPALSVQLVGSSYISIQYE